MCSSGYPRTQDLGKAGLDLTKITLSLPPSWASVLLCLKDAVSLVGVYQKSYRILQEPIKKGEEEISAKKKVLVGVNPTE